jgi:hypothetical protein
MSFCILFDFSRVFPGVAGWGKLIVVLPVRLAVVLVLELCLLLFKHREWVVEG